MGVIYNLSVCDLGDYVHRGVTNSNTDQGGNNIPCKRSGPWSNQMWHIVRLCQLQQKLTYEVNCLVVNSLCNLCITASKCEPHCISLLVELRTVSRYILTGGPVLSDSSRGIRVVEKM